MCETPFRVGAAEFGCARCLPCLINRRRLWGTRLELEALSHPVAFFLTLTLSEDYINYAREKILPVGSDFRRGVFVREPQLFIKKVRERLSGECVRYFYVGEYGEHTWRPHYHVVLFGGHRLSTWDGGTFTSVWANGGVHAGPAEVGSFGYVTGYVSKRLFQSGAERLGGRPPEFARMSLRPGLGAMGLQALVDFCVSRDGARFISQTGDVPRSVRIRGHVVALGRYLVDRLRSAVGVPAPDGVLRLSEELYVEMIGDGGKARASARRQGARQAKVRVQIKNSIRSL